MTETYDALRSSDIYLIRWKYDDDDGTDETYPY